MGDKEKEFGLYLKGLRDVKKYSIRKLEELSGVSNAYLSQLENGKKSIPTPEILKKLHKPLEVEYRELMEKAGYISSEIDPETLNLIKTEPLDQLIENTKYVLKPVYLDDNGRIREEIAEYFIEAMKFTEPEMDEEDIHDIVYGEDFFNQIFEKLNTNEQINLLNIMVRSYVGNGDNPDDIFRKNRKTAPTLPTINVPILGYIAAGCPILAEEHIEDWTELPNMWNLKDNEVFILKVKGDSMIGSRIYDGDMVVVKIQQEVESGEIAAVNVNGEEATLKRIKRTEDGQVILFPDNPKYDPIFITNENARILGKVIQVLFEPKKSF